MSDNEKALVGVSIRNPESSRAATLKEVSIGVFCYEFHGATSTAHFSWAFPRLPRRPPTLPPKYDWRALRVFSMSIIWRNIRNEDSAYYSVMRTAPEVIGMEALPS